jgi:hypothetical protein
MPAAQIGTSRVQPSKDAVKSPAPARYDSPASQAIDTDRAFTPKLGYRDIDVTVPIAKERC